MGKRGTAGVRLGLVVAMVGLGGAWLASCGGDSAVIPAADGGTDATADATTDTNPPPEGGGKDRSSPDTGPKDTGAQDTSVQDTSVNDTGNDVTSDVMTSCSPDGSACSVGGMNELCTGGSCLPCTGPGDDATCSAAYADGGASGYICAAPQCVPGDCHDDTSCATGQICGVTTPNLCGSCTTDAQCQADMTYGMSTVCDTTMGLCVPNDCPVANVNQVCPKNPADYCCNVGGPTECVAGNCCTDAQCTGSTPACDDSHVCVACDGPVNGAYFVDPVNGSDSAASSGSHRAGGTPNNICAFKTLRHAFAVIGASAAAGTTVTLLGDVSNAVSGETFPLDVPANTTVVGGGHTVSVSGSVPTADAGTLGADGFHLRQPASGLSALTLDGTAETAGSRGVVAGAGSTATTSVAQITVTGFPDAGIRVEDTGVLAVGCGTVSTLNFYGIHVVSGVAGATAGNAAITCAALPGIAFDRNTAGLVVEGTAYVSVTGMPGALGTGTVQANGNTGAGGLDGVVFRPATNTTGTLPAQSVVTGLVAAGTSTNGLHVLGGANVKVRGSVFVSNTRDGILVDANPDNCGGGATCDDNTFTGVDLGTAANADWGANLVQSAAAGTANGAVGICFAPAQTGLAVGHTLKADGNVFGMTNCAVTSGMLTRVVNCNLASGADLGVPTSPLDSVSTTRCTN